MKRLKFMSVLVYSLIFMLLLMPLIISLSFTNNPEFNSGLFIFSDDDLVCTWNMSIDATTQNITIYKDGVLFEARNETGTLNTSYIISSSNTLKNQDWNCTIRLNNATSSTIQSTEVSIANSAPETPIIYNSTYDDIGVLYNVTEDTTYIFDVNSSDIDNDVLYYYFKSLTQEFCTMSDTALGIASCTPTQSDLISNNITEVNVTFWVDDDDIIKAKSASLKVTFNVIPFNDAPTTSLSYKETLVNTSLNYDITASDEELNYPLNFSLVAPPELFARLSIVNLSNTTARIIYDASSPDYNDVGLWDVQVNITDSNGASAVYNYSFNITPVGRNPYFVNITPTGPYIINQGEFIQINITANDPDANETITFSDDATFFNIATIQPYTNISNATAQINFTPGDDAVGTFNVIITIEDIQTKTNTTTLQFIVNNINDAPLFYEMSYDGRNTLNNQNISNITAYVGAPLIYVINATDLDLDSGDSLTYVDNTSLFNITQVSNQGIINFTPGVGGIGVHSINITVTDNQSVTVYKVMTLNVLANTPPYFNQTIQDIICNESVLCNFDLGAYTDDADIGDYIENYQVVFTGNTLDTFDINTTTGIINFTPNQTEIGSYEINLTIFDTKGASNSTIFNITINNTEETPELIRYDFSSALIVETHSFAYQLQATDNDLLIPGWGESLTFTDNLSFTTITYQQTVNDTGYAMLSFTPGPGEVGTHTIEINVTDNTGLVDTQTFTFTVYADTDPPNISQIRPYGNSSNNNAIIDDWISTSNVSNPTVIRLNENQTITYAHVTTDDTTPYANLNYWWFVDDVLVATTHNYTVDYDFYSSGNYNVTLKVGDERLENSSWSWDVTVVNVNRPPLFLNNLTTPLVINTTTTYASYIYRTNEETKFIDPDDDISGNNIIDGGETNTLSYASTACTVATISFVGTDLKITPTAEGACTVRFTATDSSGANTQSNLVLINVTDLPEGEQETTTVSQPSGGGGSSTTRTSYVPITQETETPEPVNILAPKVVTIYENTSVVIPVEVKNTWSETLEYITLSVDTNETNLTTLLSSNIIESLEPNETVELELTVSDYRLGENYEVELFANVSDPAFVDSALILLNSIEQASEGDQLEIKVTFARDLFNEHPECQELNELLDQANLELSKNNYVDARKYVDTAINGCRYMVSTLERNIEKPDAIPNLLTLDELTFKTLLYAALAFIVLITIGFIVYYHYSEKEDDDI